MGNRLKNVFSTKPFELGGNIRFDDAESSRKFAEALSLLHDTGHPVEVEGVKSISTSVKDDSAIYPPFVQEHIEKIVISLQKDPLPVEIETTSGKKEVNLYRCRTNREVIIETDENAVVYLKISALKDNPIFNFTYRMQLSKAVRVKDVAEGIHDAEGIIRTFFGPIGSDNIKEGEEDYANLLRSFHFTGVFFDKLCALENKLKMEFDPQKVGNIDESMGDVYELYRLLIEKEPVRLDAKLTTTTATGITVVNDSFEHKLGASIDLTFGGEATYEICGQIIQIYTANLLTNAIVTGFKTDSAGMTNMLYGDTDSNPMYISYRGFIRKAHATSERKKIMIHKQKYKDALTVEQYIAKCNQ